MSLDRNRVRQLLATGEFQSIFIEELGWDRHSSPLEITASDASVRLQALAQKRGMVAYHCPPPSGESLPDYPQRRKIEQQVAKFAHEHLSGPLFKSGLANGAGLLSYWQAGFCLPYAQVP